MPTKTVLDILESQNVITAEEAKSIRQESRESGKSIYDILSQRKVEEAVVVELEWCRPRTSKHERRFSLFLPV